MHLPMTAQPTDTACFGALTVRRRRLDRCFMVTAGFRNPSTTIREQAVLTRISARPTSRYRLENRQVARAPCRFFLLAADNHHSHFGTLVGAKWRNRSISAAASD